MGCFHGFCNLLVCLFRGNKSSGNFYENKVAETNPYCKLVDFTGSATKQLVIPGLKSGNSIETRLLESTHTGKSNFTGSATKKLVIPGLKSGNSIETRLLKPTHTGKSNSTGSATKKLVIPGLKSGNSIETRLLEPIW